jgi:nucleoside-diphosphate-sugar epimerase
MRVFVTGASGWIGSAVVPELINAGHQVVGLARSDASAEAILAAGAEVLRGDLDDLDALRAGADASDGVIHLAFIHDFSAHEAAARTDLRAIETIGGVLEGSDRPLVIASGAVGIAPGHVATEQDRPEASASPRLLSEQTALGLAANGVRSSSVRLAPNVHGEGDHGFVATLAGIAREKGVSGYIGDGANRWPAVHRLDAARLFRLALEQAPAGSALHGVAEEGIPVRSIAGVIGQQLDLPVVSVDPEAALEHFSWLGRFLGFDSPASNAITRELLGWEPTHPTLLEDLEKGYYTQVGVS